jgi:hypothetical protein
MSEAPPTNRLVEFTANTPKSGRCVPKGDPGRLRDVVLKTELGELTEVTHGTCRISHRARLLPLHAPRSRSD